MKGARKKPYPKSGGEDNKNKKPENGVRGSVVSNVNIISKPNTMFSYIVFNLSVKLDAQTNCFDRSP